MELLAADFFCGRGGVTRGLQAAGFRVVGWDIVRKRAYPGELVLQDARAVDGARLRGRFAFLWGSPPCGRFTRAAHIHGGHDPRAGLELVHAFLRLVREAAPLAWALENVTDAEPHITAEVGAPPLFTFRHSIGGRRCVWGDLDPPLMPDYRSRRRLGPTRSKPETRLSRAHVRDPWKRAEVEPTIAGAIGRAAMATVLRRAPERL